MGIIWSCIGVKPKPTPAQIPVPAPAIPSDPIPEPDPVPTTTSIGQLTTDGDESFMGSNVSGGNSWISMINTSFSKLMSQASGALASVRGNSAHGDKDFLLDSELKVFTFSQLKNATSNFQCYNLLGRGGFGSVYKGWIEELLPSNEVWKRPVAVKRLDSSSKQGFQEWQAEVGFLSKLSHPNIVKLLGYCEEERLIVYEFMKNRSLNYHLFADSSKRLLPWEIRIKIAIGMAKGLAYLHTWEKPIIFRDFKSSNILLDKTYTAKISDFGLAKLAPTVSELHVPVDAVGTHGYADPEYMTKGNLHLKVDVYSFGVVLAEMLTGLPAIDKNRPFKERKLVDWICPHLSDKRKLKKIMDSKLKGKYGTIDAIEIASLARRCLHSEPKYRPSMTEISDVLEKIGSRYNTTL